LTVSGFIYESTGKNESSAKGQIPRGIRGFCVTRRQPGDIGRMKMPYPTGRGAGRLRG
jgi:hypothetical protein